MAHIEELQKYLTILTVEMKTIQRMLVLSVIVPYTYGRKYIEFILYTKSFLKRRFSIIYECYLVFTEVLP